VKGLLALLTSIGVLGVALPAQVIPGPRWYRTARGLIALPPANASALELARLERYLVFGLGGCSGLTAPEYAANLQVVRNMTSYLTAAITTAADPEARAVALRLNGAFSGYPCAFPGKAAPPPEPPPPPKPGDPPFALKAPDLGKVPDEQQESAADLVIRYDTDAARSAGIWKNAEKLRISLSGRGLSMNTQTATAVGRLQLLYEEAGTELRAHNWSEALSTLQAAEATTQKVAATVGQ
jgi:hypothetical protein